ncbi:MAG: prephenate dehydrogenase/arogenate dehydrogenase family protein [Arenicellales bacterium]|nr:prephenate dehydrogenase/arogenate dehydrogenase family protein [Arenicellales bacterium]
MTESDVVIERLTLIGVGLIGGSLARSLKQAGAVGEVVGLARTEATLRKALELGVIDRAETEVERAAQSASVVVIATPMQVMPQMLADLDRCVGPDTVITDVGSVKGYVVEAAQKQCPHNVARFVPGHPIAGKEHAGVEASYADLFVDKSVILTPTKHTDNHAVQLVTSVWQQTGADVQTMDVRVHDRLLAATSHLPHMVAYALVNFLAKHSESETLFKLAAGGFYDFTRIASSDPVMWRDICMTNREEILQALKGYRSSIDTLFSAIEAGDGDALHECFQRAKLSRDKGLDSKNKVSAK